MTTPLAHPLVSSYLRDLEMLLHGVDPVERADVLGGVREHLDASLVPGASDDDVRAALAELGSPHAVADEAYADRPAPEVISPPRPRPSPWLAHVACFLNALILLILTFVALSSPHPSELIFIGIIFVIPWFFLIVLTSMTEVWKSPEKFRSILLVPGFVLAVATNNVLVREILESWSLYFATTLVLSAGAVLVLARLIRATRT